MKSRMTRQKDVLLDCLESLSDYFSAEELYALAKKRKNKISLATVYRFLKLLLKQRMLHAYTCERRMVYSKKRTNHVHFICQECKSVTHFDVDSLDFIKKKLPGSLCHFEIEVSGVCESCLKKEKKKEQA